MEYALKIQVLRLVGNSCADTGRFLRPVLITRYSLTGSDENRARVVADNYLLPVIMQLKDTSLLPFAIPVLYNICVDYGMSIISIKECWLT